MEEKEFALGSVIGAFLGDAMGGVLEFSWPFTKEDVTKAMNLPGGGKLRLGEGQFTDDSEMAMCQINALKNKKSTDGLPLNDLLTWYKRWAFDGPFDIGVTTTSALFNNANLPIQVHIERVKNLNSRSKSNGSMMRMTPLCVWVRNLPIEKQVECFRLDSQLTHPNQSVVDACCTYGLAISSLIRNSGNVSQTLDVVEMWTKQHANQEVKDWLIESEMENLDNFKVNKNIGFVRWGFTLAFYFLRHEFDYQTAIEKTLVLGGDTDTNAAIVGGIMGAKVGLSKLPKKEVDKMLSYEYRKGDSKGHIRPTYLLPKNLIIWINELIQSSN